MAEINTTFHEIDFAHWNRQSYFYYFTKMLPTGYSLTVEIDITETKKAMKSVNQPFMAAYLFIVANQLASQQELRISTLNGSLGYFECLHPSYAIFHDDDHTISNIWTEYVPSFRDFSKNYEEDMTQYRGIHGPSAKPIAPPPNLCMIGMLPWIQFTHYSPVPYMQGDCYFPVIQAGKYFERNHRLLMLLSIMIHHAVADGFHVSTFLEGIQKSFNTPAEWMDIRQGYQFLY